MADRVVLTTEQALSMLPEGDRIHTFRSGGMAMLGCDWDRDRIEKAIRDNTCELGGATSMVLNHGLVINVDGSALFVECRDGLDYAEFEGKEVAP